MAVPGPCHAAVPCGCAMGLCYWALLKGSAMGLCYAASCVTGLCMGPPARACARCTASHRERSHRQIVTSSSLDPQVPPSRPLAAEEAPSSAPPRMTPKTQESLKLPRGLSHRWPEPPREAHVQGLPVHSAAMQGQV